MYSENNESGLPACVRYFKENKGFRRIFSEMLSKWKSYGKVAGVIKINGATAEEYRALQGLMGKACEGEPLKFRMTDFQQALKESRFGAVTLEALLSAYFDEELTTTKSERLARAGEQELFWQDVMAEADRRTQGSDAVKQWLLTMREKKTSGYQIALSMVQKDRESARNTLLHVCSAIWILRSKTAGGRRIRLAVLSSRVSGNPHFFDRNRAEGKLLLNALAYIHVCDYPQKAEKILELYYSSGISPDDISSFTTAYGIHMYTERGVHGAYEVFIREREPYVVTLSNLNHIVKVDCPGKFVYIVENQMVFSQICEEITEKDAALICTSGQVKTASLILIDLLCEAGCRLFYSGDLDPEGICIADKMISRHPGQIVAWHMSPEDYARCVSDEDIGEKRLKQLDTIVDLGLRCVAAEVISVKKAGYQEQLLEVLEGDIKAAIIGD